MPSEASRFAARARADRRHRRRRVLRLVGAVAGPPVVVAGLAFSPLCDVDAVQVSGTTRVSPAAVRAAAGVASGQPLALVDLDAVGRRVERVTGVKSVRVRRSWPSRLVIRVVERVPALAVPLGAYGVALYDVEGVLVDHAPLVPAGTPLLRLDTGAGRPDRDLVAAAIVLVRTLPPPLRAQVASLHAGSAADLTAVLRDGTEIVWGDGSRAGEKLRALQALLRQRARRYDVRVPGIPVAVRPSPAPS